MPTTELPVNFIATTDQLDAFCQQSLSSDVLGVDTEFMWEKTYYPQACLIQVSNAHQIACIDPLTLTDLSPLKSLFEHQDIIKIVHSGSQDMVLFEVLMGSRPSPLFDTQIAASFLDMGEQLSYAHLIETLCSVSLDKSQSRTNWAQRPLSALQLQYAADDVRYLPRARSLLLDQLQENIKNTWLDDENRALSTLAENQHGRKDLLRYVKGSRSLRPQQLQIAQALAQWREQRAQKKDRPRRWMLADAVILELSQQQPETLQQLKQLETMTPALLKQGELMLDVIATSNNKPQSGLPDASAPLTGAQKSQLKQIQALVRTAAKKHVMSPSIIGSRRGIEQLIRGELDQPLLSGWREQLVGIDIRELLTQNGETD